MRVFEKKVRMFLKCVNAVFLAVISVVGMMLVGIGGLEANAAEVVTSPKKIISVVYDDSGSMYRNSGVSTTNWSQANYALQAFAALLSEQDEMYITYMSSATVDASGNYVIDSSQAESVDMSNIDASVQTIRSKTDYGDTPVQAVDAAMDKLKQVQDSDANTQYWLVVLTDGHMYSNEAEGDAYRANIQSTFDNYKGTVMPNGSTVYMTYMAIGDEADEISGDSANGLDAIKTSNITESLSEIANKVAGRLVFDDTQISVVDSRTVTVSSDIPLYSIAVFSQKSNAQVESVTDASYIRNVELKHPDVPAGSSFITDESLYGNAALAYNDDGSLIDAGSYTITFSEDVDLENVVIMYQPAIVMQPKITKNGVTLDNDDLKNQLADGDVVDIELVPTNPETGETIADNCLPDGITWSISYSVDGTVQASADERILRNVQIQIGENEFECSMNIPNMVPQTEKLSFELTEPDEPIPVEYDVNFDTGSGDAVYNRSKMGLNGSDNPMTFTLMADGSPVGKDEMPKENFSIESVSLDYQYDGKVKSFFSEWGCKEAETLVKQQKDGSFVVYPKRELLSFLYKPGDYTVTVSIVAPDGNTYQATGTYTVVGHWTDWLVVFVLAAIIALILYIVIGLILIKPKFSGQKLTVKVYCSDGDSGGIYKRAESETQTLKSFSKLKDFTPRASRYTVCGLDVVATNGGVVIDKKCLENFIGFGKSHEDPTQEFADIVAGLSEITEKGAKPIRLSNSPICLYGHDRLYVVTLKRG